MQTTQPRNRLPRRLGVKRHAAELTKRVAAVFALAAVVALTIHYANRSLEAPWPDPFHSPAGAAAPPVVGPANALGAEPASSYFPAQFPPPQGPIVPQPETF